MTSEELAQWFEQIRTVMETAYLARTEPWGQSGFSGPENRGTSLRKPVADCMDRDGSFLDIGCANGYLLECCVRWTAARGIRIEPYGVDISARSVGLAKQRLPQWAGRFFAGNAFDWRPPFQFDFVRTELVYVPGEYEREYVLRLLKRFVKPGGRLLVANYTEDNPELEGCVMPASKPPARILNHLAALGFNATDHKDGFDPVKGRKMRVAILSN